MKNDNLKVFLGAIIFLFSLAFAYFTASYLSNSNLFDYWGALALFAGAYVLVGIIVSSIFSISLGFLFAADVLVLHILFQYFGGWADAIKLAMIGGILIVLYVAAAMGFVDRPKEVPAPVPAPATPQ